jgi:DnaK suppressor protein
MGAKTATTKTATAKVAKAAKTAAPAAKAAPAVKKTAAAVKTAVKAAPKSVPKPAPRPTPQPAMAARNTPPTPSSKARTTGTVMSEAEILAAPEKDYMNPSQLQFFKVRLQTMEQDILRNAGETTEHLRESIIVPDPADRATIEEEHALELRTRDRERKLLKKIQQSIHRIDSGEYGYCEETGDPIGVPRLLARPTATLSLEAQERREMKQKMFGE